MSDSRARPWDIQVRGTSRPALDAPGQSVNPRTLAVNIALPEVEPPRGHQDFIVDANVASAAVEVLMPAAFAFAVPEGFVGVIKTLDLYINDMIAVTDVRFTLRVNGVPVPGFARRRIFPRAAANVSRGFDVTIRLPETAVIDAQLENITGGAHLLGMSYRGWIWPRELELGESVND